MSPQHPPEPSDHFREQVQWLYRNGASYLDILAHNGDAPDNATLARLLGGVHVAEPLVMRRSVRSLLTMRDTGKIDGAGQDRGFRPEGVLHVNRTNRRLKSSRGSASSEQATAATFGMACGAPVVSAEAARTTAASRCRKRLARMAGSLQVQVFNSIARAANCTPLRRMIRNRKRSTRQRRREVTASR